ncbi:MAG: pyruvate dehydrogenase (acetyl-transferring) E1 component subunit alpha, partial [Candidatus Promineifilaceae bacterium]|nr:pyruvate dehydrogenase (acetyl-transferring) E1 component subunit alpha [Candidatus Promineifilaceae bacterium]
MPREVIELPHDIEYLSVLDEEGNLDEELEPDLADDFLLDLYRAMLLARRLDERMLNLQRQGRIGTFAPLKGQEASEIGAVAALRDSDWMVQSYREQAAALWRGQSIENYLLVYGGFYQGGELPDDSRDLPVSIPVSTQILHAAGISYGIKYREEEDVVMVFFGDGATSEGDFHEGLNFAGVFQTPIVFVCQNNQYAISVPRSRQTHAKTIAQKALAYGVHGIQVDGNDVLAVHTAAQEAVERARSGEGPTLVENVTYRLSLHTTADDPTRYRDEEEVEKWEARDPIPRFQNYLMAKDLLSEEDVEALEEEIEAEIQDAVDAAEAEMESLAGE